MPRLNRAGQAVMGLGGVPASVDGRLVGSGRGCVWDGDPRYLIGQNPIGDPERDPWRVYRIRVDGSEPPQLLDMRLANGADLNVGAQRIRVGTTRRAIWCGGNPPTYYDSARLGGTPAGRSPLAMDASDILVDCDYLSGADLRATNASGTDIWDGSSWGQVVDSTAMRDGYFAAWCVAGGRWRIVDFNMAPQPPRETTAECVWGQAIRVVPFRYQDALWLLECGSPGYELRLRRCDSYLAHVVTGPSETSFSPDVVVTDSGEVVVAWSVTEGEGPTDLRTWRGDPATLPTTDIRTPLELPTPLLPDIVIPPQRPAWIVDTEGIVTPRGNGISTSDGAGPRFFEDALWTRADMEPGLEGIYWGPEPPRNNVSREDAFALCRDIAVRNRVPVFVCDEWGYDATKDWIARFTDTQAVSWWLLELYRFPNEDREAYRARIAARLSAHLYYGIIAPLFDAQGGGSELECCATLDIIQEEIAKQKNPPLLIDLFGLRRPPISAWRINYASQWIAKTPQPASLRQPVVVTPPPPPKAPDPIVVPGHGHNADPPVKKRRLFKGK